MEEYQFSLGQEELTIHIARSRRKSIAMNVRGGVFTVRAPFVVSDGYIKQFVEKNRDWIISQKERIDKETQESQELLKLPDRPLTNKEMHNIKDAIEDRTVHFAKIMQVSYGRITVRDQKTRWGSCSSDGNLNFNYKIYFMPARLMDYVIIHELSHRVHMNHSKDFWNLVGQYCPKYKERVAELKKLH